MKSIIKILFKRSYLSLFVTQFLGAFNDNFFRTAMATFVLYNVFTITEESKAVIVSLAIALFMLPYFLFSALAGELADKYSKASIIKVTKGFEIFVVMLAVAGFLSSNVALLLFVLFLMGAQSTFFGPVKYSILPDILREDELIAGNGLIEAGTYAAILQGTILGGIILTFHKAWLPGALLGAALLGFSASLFIPRQRPCNEGLKIEKNFIKSTWKNMRFAAESRDILLCILGISWFWLLGTALLSQMPVFSKSILGGDQSVFTLFLTLFSIGIGLGSIICQFLLKGEITVKYVPLSAILMTLFLGDLAFAVHRVVTPESIVGIKEVLSTFNGKRIVFDLCAFAICGGLYIVPLNAMLQNMAGELKRSRIIATNNIINALFMAVGSGLCALLLGMGLGVPGIFAAVAIANAFVAVYICALLPEHIVRMIAKRILNFMYDVKISGKENLDKLEGNTLIIANHTSFLDAVLIWVYIPQNLYFAINSFVAKKWWVMPFLKFVKYFPIDPTSPMAVKSIIDEVKQGRRVVIFPEGRITTTGSLMKIYPGPAMIAEKSGAQILPVSIEGSQYSIFSRFGNKFKTRPQSKITLNIMPPRYLDLPAQLQGRKRRVASARKLYDIMCDMKYQSAPVEETLFDSLLDAKSLVGRNKVIVEDMSRKKITFGQLLTVIFVLGKQFAKQNKQGSFVGFMLPNSVAAVGAFFGLRAFNLTPCMLNFSTGVKNMLSCCRAAEIKNVYTSKEFVQKGGLEPVIEAMRGAGINVIYLEDVRKQISVKDKIVALAASYFPRLYYKKVRGNVTSKDPAVVLFTSGSEGVPKGVVLSHENVQANCAQLQSVLDFGLLDKVFNAMPIFHSFGLTGGMLLPLLSGIKTFFYPSPLHYRIVPELIYETNSTIIFGTDTFLSGYAKMAHPYDFYSVRLAVAGAEKLKEETARVYADIFGVRILEGYGATETAPGISINTPMYFKRGTVGRLLPGIEVMLEEVPGMDEGKRLYVKGKNIMLGYLKEDKPGVVQEPEGGWYDTGDIVDIDENGFVSIKGRAKRFAKIAGEMVSLSAVETTLSALWPQEKHAVVSIPDERKGEQLVLFTSRKETTQTELAAAFRAQGLSELSVPRKIKIVEDIPLMGTGKTDYVKLNEIALEN
ncbi:acyltransferase [Elusimicrobium posterum]|uniref:acyl-[ACP]--phospholipid O-acyltransferase n=1 Tax=Elusimicrobium posterum TaxID=3116653 RepID=UPI003C782224